MTSNEKGISNDCELVAMKKEVTVDCLSFLTL
jgi:hypothetical protein